MIKRKEEMKTDIREAMRGGLGHADVTSVLEKGEYNGGARLVGTITLNENCSIGTHIHENEEEIFYVISGTAEYFDNGEWVTLHEGDSCVCLSGQSHSILNRGKEAVKVFALILTY